MERFLLITSLIFVTSFSWARTPLEPQEVTNILDEFAYDGTYTELKNKKSGGGFFSKCATHKITYETTYPSATEPLEVKMIMYMPTNLGDNKVPAVIMLPPIGGTNTLDESMAESFCDSKTAALIITNDFAHIQKQARGKLLPPSDHQEAIYRVTAAVKGAMTKIEEDKNLDYERIGIFGVSLGGILSSFVMSTQPDISAGFFVVSGGDIPNILAHSKQDEVSRIRSKRMKEQNIKDIAEYEEFLREHITLDPVDMALTMLPETIQMVVSNSDDNVPTTNQKLLHDAFGKPEAEYYNSGHVWTVISFLGSGGARRGVVKFFKDRFALDNPRPTLFEDLYQHLYLY